MRTVPARARTAAWLFLVCAALLLAGALLWPPPGAGGVRAALRCAGLVVIALGLLRGARWAWLAGVVFPSFWALSGIVMFTIAFTGGAGNAILSLPLVAAGAAVLLLTAGVGLLLSADVRRLYSS